MEIERKFLVKHMPEDLEQYPCRRIEQVYLSTKPVIRARRMDDAYILTCKGKGLLAREEHEMHLDAEEYGELFKRAEGTPIAKNRYLIPYGAHTIELDVFDAPFAPLVVAEVEFSSEEEAAAFAAPDWFGEDVTCDPAYTNAALSRRPSLRRRSSPAAIAISRATSIGFCLWPAIPRPRSLWWSIRPSMGKWASGCVLPPCGTRRLPGTAKPSAALR